MSAKTKTGGTGSMVMVTSSSRLKETQQNRKYGLSEVESNAKKPMPLSERPEFTTLMKTKLKSPPGGKENMNNNNKQPPRISVSRSDIILARRERTAQNLSYEGILHEQLVMQKALLIRAQAASYGHDPLVVMSYVGQRAQETIDEDVNRLINELTEINGHSPSHRMTAYAEISNDLAKQLESVVFDQHFDKVMEISHEFKLREEELKQREKATTQEVQVRMDEISNLVKANIELEQDKKAMERVTDMMKKEVEDALHYQVEAQQKLVEVRMQGLDFKSEIDRRVEKVMASIEGQMGYIPDAVEKQLFYVQILKPPGDPDYDEVRRAGDVRAEKKYQIMKKQPSNGDPAAKKWFHTVMEGDAPQLGNGTDDDNDEQLDLDEDDDNDDGLEGEGHKDKAPRLVAIVKARLPSRKARRTAKTTVGSSHGGTGTTAGAALNDAGAPVDSRKENQALLAQLMKRIVGKGAEQFLYEEKPKGRGKGKKADNFEYMRKTRNPVNLASLTQVYPYGLTHSPPNREEQQRREIQRLRQQQQAMARAALNVSSVSSQYTPSTSSILLPAQSSTLMGKQTSSTQSKSKQSNVSKRLAAKKSTKSGRRDTVTKASVTGTHRNVAYPMYTATSRAGDLAAAGAVIDETYDKFRSSIDMLRKNIVHGTVASISTGSGAVGGVGRGVDLVNISAVTQATAFATGDPDRSYGAAVVPVGQGHRKKRRTLAAKRQVDKVSYLMNKSTESYATRTVKALSEASKVDAPKGTEEDDVLEAALTGKNERSPADWETWALFSRRQSMANRDDIGGDSAALSLIGQEVAMEVAAAAEVLTTKRMASKQAAIESLAAAKERAVVSDQSMLTAQSLLPPQREELYSSGGSRSATGQSSHSSGDDSDLLGKHGSGDHITSTSSSSSGNTSFLRERVDPIVEAEERALEALRRKFAHVDIGVGLESAASTPGSRAGPMFGSRTGARASASAGEDGRGGMAVRLPSPQKQASAAGGGPGPSLRRQQPTMTKKQSFDDSDDDDDDEDDVYLDEDEEEGAEENYVSSTDDEDSLNAATAATEDSDRGHYPSAGQLDKYMEQIYMGDKKARRR